MSPRDTVLLKRWSDHRDAEAFNDLVSAYADMVYATCKRILGNSSDAEELTQECLLKLATGRVRIHTSLGGWLHSAATSLSINRIRSDARRRKREEKVATGIPLAEETSWDDIQAYVDEAIAELPENLREPIIRHFLQRETHEQIARDLKVSRSAITKRISDGIDKVRERLKKGGVITSAAVLAALAAERMAEAAPAELKAALGKLALSGVAQSAAVAGAAGSLLFAKAVAALVVTAIAGAGAWVAYDRMERPAPPAQQAQAAPAVTRAVAAKPVPAADKAATVAPVAATPAAAGTEKQTVTVSGRVYDRDTGEGIAGAELSLRTVFGSQEAVTNEDGEFRVDEVPAVICTVGCRKANGYYLGHELATRDGQLPPTVRELRLTKGHDYTGLDFALSRGEGVTGNVVDVDGRPVAGALVTGFANVNHFNLINTVESREDGTFTVTGFPRTVGLYVWADKGELVSTEVGPYALPQEGRTLAPVILQQEAILRGVLQDTQGRPIAGLKFVPQFGRASLAREREVLSGPDGRFELKGMPSGNTIMRVCRDVEIVNSPCPSMTLTPGQVIDDLVLTCAVGSQSIAGHVVDSRGNPVFWAQVEYKGGEPLRQGFTNTDREGKFVLDGLVAGAYTLTTTPEKHLQPEPMQVAAGNTNVRIVVPDAISVEGTVVDAVTGKPVPSYFIKYCYFPEEIYLDQRYEKTSNPEGAFKLPVAQLGETRIAARAEGYLLEHVEIPVDGSKATIKNVVLRMRPQADLRGGVHDAQGRPVGGAIIFSGASARFKEENYAAARTGDDGSFVIPAHKLGDDTILVVHPNYPNTDAVLEQKHFAGEPIDVTIGEGTALACTVTANGEPCQEVGIHASPVTHPQDRKDGRTGPDGRCVIGALTPGEYLVIVQLPAAPGASSGATINRNVTLVEGQTAELDVDFGVGDASVTGELDTEANGGYVTLTVTSDRGEQFCHHFFQPGSPDRSFTFSNLPAGEAVLKVSWTPVEGEQRGNLSRRYAFTLTPGAAIRQDIRTEGAAIWGRVTGLVSTDLAALNVLNGSVASDKVLSFDFEESFCGNIPVAPDGTFRMEGFEPGTYTLVAMAAPRERPSQDQARVASTIIELTAEGQEVSLHIP